jgi:hypothetical protein
VTVPGMVATSAASSYRPSGHARARLNRWKIVLFAGVGLVVLVGVASVLVAIREPGPAQPDCRPDQPCLPPSPSNGAVTLGRVWVSPDLDYSFQYPTDWLRVASEDGTSVHLDIPTDRWESEIWVSGAPANESSTKQLLEERRDALAERVVGLKLDDDSPDRIVAPSLGFVSGVGSAYRGTLDSASGPTKPASVAILAAGNGKVNVVMSVLLAADGLDHDLVEGLRIAAGRLIVDTMRWD